MTWRWSTASNRERAESVRSHAGMGRECPQCHKSLPGKLLTAEALCDLFDLTDDELVAVLAGADYPERRALTNA
jgi:hypothetical protein